MYPSYNNQYYAQDLQNMRDRIDKQLQQLQQVQQYNQPQQVPNINQTFQLAPTQNNSGVKYAESLDDVKKELVFGDTLFVNKEYKRMWLKNARGETKEYELIQIVEQDPSALKIEELTANNEELRKEINELKKVIENAKSNNEFINDTTKKSKSTSISNDK